MDVTMQPNSKAQVPPVSDTPAPRGFWAAIGRWLDVAGLFLWGSGIAAFFGQELQHRRWPDSPWRWPLLIVVAVLIWELFRPNVKQAGEQYQAWMGFCLSLGTLYLFRSHDWVPPAVGAVFSGYFWALGKLRRRPIPIAVAGCLLAGAAVLLVPWPNEQRSLLVLACAGTAVALQGAWKIISHLRGQCAELLPEPAPTGRSLGKLILRTLGKIECQQIISPALEHHLRSRHQFRIDELAGLGFSYLCCYTESFSATSLLFLLPALAVLSMQRGRDMVRLRKGRIYTHYLLLISRDNTTYAHALGLRVKFHSAFTDGTFLVTANFAGQDIERPPMVKHYREDGIPEAWANHQCAIQALEAAGKHAIQQASFLTFADISARETAVDLDS